MSDQTALPTDTFQLQDFFQLLWAKKKILLAGVASAILIGAIYTLASPKSFRVHSKVKETASTGTRILGAPPYLSLGLDLTTRFFDTAVSESFRREFFDKHGLFAKITNKDASKAQPRDVDAVFFKQFSAPLRVEILQEKPLRVYGLSFAGTDPVKAATWLNEFVDEANSRAAALEFEVVRNRLNVMREDLSLRIQSQVASAREAEKRRVDYQLARLKTARSIAKKMGLSGPAGAFAGSVDEWGKPLAYFRGEKALEAEISVLSSLKDFTPDPSEMDLLVEYNELNAVKIVDSGVKAVDIVNRASASVEQLKPSAAMILSLAAFVGLFLASLGVLISQFFKAGAEQVLAYRPA